MKREGTKLDWLLAKNRNGERRVDRLGWRHLSKIYHTPNIGKDIRRAIEGAARRCGYRPATVLALHNG